MEKKIARMLPSSVEAEQGLLSSILLDDKVMMNVAPKLFPEDFYSLSHKVIYENMMLIYKETQPVDFITLVNKLEENNKLEEVGGLDYITTLTNFLPGSANYEEYLRIVKNHSSRRRLINASQRITEQCYENESAIDDINFAEKEIFQISQQGQITSLEHIAGSLNTVMDKFDQIAQFGGQVRGVPTGFTELDTITNGLQNSDLILLAARPGVGKTSFAMNIINNAAINHKKACAVFSLEMATDQIAQRSLCSTACVNMGKALTGKLNEEEWQKLWVAKKQLSDAPIYVDAGKNTVEDIISKCRVLKMKQGLDLVMVDYLQFIYSSKEDARKEKNRTLEIGEITKSLKMAAKELNIPVLLLSQLSRDVEKRPDHRPVLADLRDSGSIEQDADIVIFLYNPAKYHEVVIEAEDQGLVELEIAKHRNGGTGTIKLRWVGEWTRFLDKDVKVKKEYDPHDQDTSKMEEVKYAENIDDVFDAEE